MAKQKHDPLKPDAALLVKLGSIAVHADELTGVDGHTFDREAIRSLVTDPDVVTWVKAMDAMALLPVKRNG